MKLNLQERMIAIAMAVLMCVLWVCAPGCAIGGVKGACRHKAVYSATVMGDFAEVEVCRFDVRPDVTHAQSRAFIDGQWKWLEMLWWWVYISDIDNEDYTIIECMTVTDYVSRMRGTGK